MQIAFELLKATWYIWTLILAVSILKHFLPPTKGFLEEKSVAFFLAKLDSAKYKVINNFML